MRLLLKKWPFGFLAALIVAQLYAAPALGAGDAPNVSESFHGWLLGIVASLTVVAVMVAGRSIILIYKLEVKQEHSDEKLKAEQEARAYADKEEKTAREKEDEKIWESLASMERDCKRRKDHLWAQVTPVHGTRPPGDEK